MDLIKICRNVHLLMTVDIAAYLALGTFGTAHEPLHCVYFNNALIFSSPFEHRYSSIICLL